jgi:hypothetical protein
MSLERLIDRLFPERKDALESKRCVPLELGGCGKPAVDFSDELSQREYLISGLCQACQDKIFCE